MTTDTDTDTTAVERLWAALANKSVAVLRGRLIAWRRSRDLAAHYGDLADYVGAVAMVTYGRTSPDVLAYNHRIHRLLWDRVWIITPETAPELWAGELPAAWRAALTPAEIQALFSHTHEIPVEPHGEASPTTPPPHEEVVAAAPDLSLATSSSTTSPAVDDAAGEAPTAADDGLDHWERDARAHIFHPSSLAMLLRCGMQYQYRYIEGLRRPPAVAMVVGTATHASIEADLRRKIETGELLPGEAIPDLAADALAERWDQVELDADELAKGADATRGEAKDKAVGLAVLHHAEVAPGIAPVHVERRFTLDIHGRAWGLGGTLDVQEPSVVRDTKTAAKTKPQSDADSSLQLTLYGLAVRVLDGRAPDSYRLDTLVQTSAGKRSYAPLTTTRGPGDFRALLRLGQMAYDVVTAGRFLPAAADAWCCSEKWCGYWQLCPFGAAARSDRPHN